MSVGTMVIELREFNDKKKKKNNMDKMQKLNFAIIWPKSGNLIYGYHQHARGGEALAPSTAFSVHKSNDAMLNLLGQHDVVIL